MKKFEHQATATILGLSIVLSAQSPSFAGRGDDAFQNTVRRGFEARSLRRERLENRRDANANLRDVNNIAREIRMNRAIDTAGSVSLFNQANLSGRLNRQLRFTSLGAGALPADLNLDSRRNTYVAPSFSGTVAITQGGREVLVNGASNLTAAEAVAVHQVLYEGGQTIILGKRGDAEGGSMNLNGDFA